MTRCKNCCYNDHLKSSVYNPSGQRYELQLTAYNSMTNHLRRVLMAKSVVDCGKTSKNLLKKKNFKYKRNFGSAREIKESVSQNIIDRLAYDTKNHPHVSASMNFILNNNQRSNNYIEMRNKRSKSAESNEGSEVQERRRFLQTKIYKDEILTGYSDCKAITESPQPCDRSEGVKIIDNRDSEIKAAKEIDYHRKVLSKSKSEDTLNMKNFRAVLPCVSSNSSDIKFSKNHQFIQSTSEINFDKFYNENLEFDINYIENDKDSIYVKFVYEITKEIMDKGYYEDNDIEMVFEKHVKRNFNKLKKEKMFEEIKFLKKSLGINFNDDENNEDDENNSSEIHTTENYLKSKNSVENFFYQPYNNNNNNNNSNNKQDSDTDNESVLKKSIIFNNNNIKDEKLLNDNNSNDIIIVLSQEEAVKILFDINIENEKALEIIESLKNRSKEIIHSSSNESKID